MNPKPAVPLNETAERATISALLRSESDYWAVSDLLRADHFHDPLHQRIFTAIRDVCLEGKKLSLTLLEARLGEEDDNGIPISSTLATLLKDSDEIGSVLDFADIVVDMWGRRRLLELSEKAAKGARNGKDLTDVIADTEAQLLDISERATAQAGRPLKQILASVMNRTSNAYQERFVPGFDTGLVALDEILGRIMPGDLGLIGASQGEAKTALATQIAIRAAQTARVAMFQLEMKDEDIGRRLLAAEADVSVCDIEEGALDLATYERVYAAAAKLGESKLIIVDKPRLKMGQIRARVIALKRSAGLGLVVVDHLRLIQADHKVKDVFERIEYVTGSLKQLAKEADVPVICLMQRTRASQDRDDPQPRVSDFFGGGSIEQDADWILGLWRRDLWLKQRKPPASDQKRLDAWVLDLERCKNQVEAIVLKRRRGQAMEKRTFFFNGKATRLEPL